MNKKQSFKPETLVAQAHHEGSATDVGVTPSIELSSTFRRDDNYELMAGHLYSRYGGPTVNHAESILAELEGGAEARLFGSGLAAVAALFETVESGRHIVAPKIMYYGAQGWMQRISKRRGIGFTLYDQTRPGALAESLKPGETDIVWVENPSNPTWDVTDLAQAAEDAHAAGAILAVDSTGAPPPTTRCLDFGADIVFHSATKYLNGHSDLTSGVLITRDKNARWLEIDQIRRSSGGIIAPFEAWLLIRGLRTLFVRFERQSANALAIAQHFQDHVALEGLRYPGLPTDPAYAIASRQMTGGFGGMLSILVKGGFEDARRIAGSTNLFIPATSLGGVESLIEHRKSIEAATSPVPDNLIRLSVGIENVSDLIEDLEQALQ